MTCYTEELPKYLKAAWRKRLALHEQTVRQPVRRPAKNRPIDWLMVNRFWYEAVAKPLLDSGR